MLLLPCHPSDSSDVLRLRGRANGRGKRKEVLQCRWQGNGGGEDSMRVGKRVCEGEVEDDLVGDECRCI